MEEYSDLSSRGSRQAYGEKLVSNYGGEEAPHMVTRVLQRAELAATELVINHPPGRIGDLIPRQDAYMICCQLQDKSSFEYWEEGRDFAVPALRPGDMTIHDLKRDPTALIDGPMHTMMWFMPRAALNALADEANGYHIDELQFDPCVAVADTIIEGLSLAILPALRSPQRVSKLFADHVGLALAAHVAHAYGGMPNLPHRAKGGLAPWQMQRAYEFIAANLDGELSVSDLAVECSLSASHFSRAFRETVGMPPHRWLLRRRIEVALEQMRDSHKSLADIAVSTGFANQSHFSDVFKRQMGVSPATWRRMRDIKPLLQPE